MHTYSVSHCFIYLFSNMSCCVSVYAKGWSHGAYCNCVVSSLTTKHYKTSINRYLLGLEFWWLQVHVSCGLLASWQHSSKDKIVHSWLPYDYTEFVCTTEQLSHSCAICSHPS